MLISRLSSRAPEESVSTTSSQVRNEAASNVAVFSRIMAVWVLEGPFGYRCAQRWRVLADRIRGRFANQAPTGPLFALAHDAKEQFLQGRRWVLDTEQLGPVPL
jgi:hypothetical protein